MPYQRPRLRNAIEHAGKGPINPITPSGGTVPNIGGSASSQSAGQITAFLVGADAYVLKTATPASSAVGFGPVISTVVTFPNIPKTQLSQNAGLALQPRKAGTFKASPNTYPLFLTSGKLLSVPAGYLAFLTITPNVRDSSGVYHTSSYLAPGITYTSFGVSVSISYYNPSGATIAASSISVELSAELIATFPGS